MADLPTKPDHCGRLASLRQTVFGPRGRAAFARALDVSPSTYNYYEKNRPPPADLLARAAQVTGADLTWLLTGAGEAFPPKPSGGADNRLSHPAEEIIARFAEALAARPVAPAEPATSFEPAAEAAGHPRTGRGLLRSPVPRGSRRGLEGNAPRALPSAAVAALRAILAQVEKSLPVGGAWKASEAAVKPSAIPVVGRTAAGLLAPWEKFFASGEDPEVLERLIAQTENRAARQRGAELLAADAAGEPDRPADATALLVQLSAPTADGILEYLELPGLGPLGAGAFALRVDGDSMSPRIRDGDLVVCRRSVPPQPGQTAVVKVHRRIGVTVKLWRPEGDHVHLIPINEACDPSRLARTEILWACRVLWVVRL
jgi:transcriptional regulator with XRE-family HTH domain